MADNVTEPEVTHDSSKEIVSYRNSKLSTTRLDYVAIANGRPGFVTQIADGDRMRFQAFHNPSDLCTNPFPSSNIASKWEVHFGGRQGDVSSLHPKQMAGEQGSLRLSR
ncbi:unnamed protein product [Schistosoma margrebowiei]|uniref:Uncharacterized protein n=1 Tax=Schistosoma margrebowiei TaxID=48269 RepID=A0A183LWW4_9TREM|nr:unnamed protein product [Schistosoma margrebowiei]